MSGGTGALLPGGGFAADRIAVCNPVFAEAGRQHDHVQMAKAHGFQRLKCRTNIGTLVDRTAAAVEVDVRILWQPANRVLQRFQSLWGGGGSGIDGPGNVLAFVQNLKAYLEDDRFRTLRKRGGQLAGLRGLRRRPGIGSGILCMGCHRQHARYSEDRSRRVPQGRASRRDFHVASVRRRWDRWCSMPGAVRLRTSERQIQICPTQANIGLEWATRHVFKGET